MSKARQIVKVSARKKNRNTKGLKSTKTTQNIKTTKNNAKAKYKYTSKVLVNGKYRYIYT